ncbi:MAG TPA: hypothetical protein DDW90_03730 [Cyanobacteria bacterium UBA9971]|nr:hypothetical protein [Cyanobacteria bacterium UBA9971]
MYIDAKFLELIITGVWIFLGILLLIINIFTQKVLLKIIGIACLVTSISVKIIKTLFSLYPQYFYLEIALLMVLGVVIFSVMRKMALKSNKTEPETNKF